MATTEAGSLPPPDTRTSRFHELRENDLEPDATVVFGAGTSEERAQLPLWSQLAASNPTRCVVVRDQEPDKMEVQAGTSSGMWISLTDEVGLSRLIPETEVYIDVSGLGHHVWAPLLRAALQRARKVYVIYVEPDRYRPHPTPAMPALFDLSHGFRSISSLPGMARLLGPDDEDKIVFVAFLGFEGNRPQQVALTLEPLPNVVPVVGVPGFRAEYPSYTVACNRDFLADYQAHSEIRLARASCPFEAYEVLEQLSRDCPDHYFYIAPVGTKPHAVGSVWYAMDHPNSTSVIYDHPIRKPGRTSGRGPVHVYMLKCAT